MRNEKRFGNRAEFRDWLARNASSGEGVWLVLEKGRSAGTVTAGEALEEALCFGWIDGQLLRVDEATYVKYFKRRGGRSRWSGRNRALALRLEAQGRMTDAGRACIEAAKRNGTWDPPRDAPPAEERIQEFLDLVKPHATAWSHYLAMPRSMQRTYAASYASTKTEEGRRRRLGSILERLERNLDPVERLDKGR